MPGARLKGQDVEVLLVADNAPLTTLSDIQSCEVMQETEVQEEGYLGEKANRYDDIYNGYSFNIQMHNSSPDYLNLLQFIKDRAQRRNPSGKINIKVTLNYPGGQRKRVILNDAFFDAAGLSAGGRSEYVSSTLTGKGTSYRIL